MYILEREYRYLGWNADDDVVGGDVEGVKWIDARMGYVVTGLFQSVLSLVESHAYAVVKLVRVVVKVSSVVVVVMVMEVSGGVILSGVGFWS